MAKVDTSGNRGGSGGDVYGNPGRFYEMVMLRSCRIRGGKSMDASVKTNALIKVKVLFVHGGTNCRPPQAAVNEEQKSSGIGFLGNLCMLSCRLVCHACVLAVGWCKS